MVPHLTSFPFAEVTITMHDKFNTVVQRDLRFNLKFLAYQRFNLEIFDVKSIFLILFFFLLLFLLSESCLF